MIDVGRSWLVEGLQPETRSNACMAEVPTRLHTHMPVAI
jgi:hypothetical protein